MTTSRIPSHHTLSIEVAREALAATADDVLLQAGTRLMLVAGLRRGEVQALQVRDWQPGEDPRLTIRDGCCERTIRIAPSAAVLLDGYRAGQTADADEPLLLGLEREGALPRLFGNAMRRAGLKVGVHDLRHAAIAAALEDGTPMSHIEAYFGLEKAETRKDLMPVREGYDRGIAAALEASFAS
ncbi:site-specific integrase (plasmid) [Streptomyces sp. NBC_01717]|uniref:site-specific integrase n=1 Tax=Streptomyces sp. NBC_01717 TaxID=2975918 RepID=UPI002E380CFF|nr:site-specific integrase [Streptomyces sp. NBC_01717]